MTVTIYDLLKPALEAVFDVPVVIGPVEGIAAPSILMEPRNPFLEDGEDFCDFQVNLEVTQFIQRGDVTASTAKLTEDAITLRGVLGKVQCGWEGASIGSGTIGGIDYLFMSHEVTLTV